MIESGSERGRVSGGGGYELLNEKCNSFGPFFAINVMAMGMMATAMTMVLVCDILLLRYDRYMHACVRE